MITTKLAWLIYLGGVSGSVSAFLLFLAVVFFVAMIVTWIGAIIAGCYYAEFVSDQANLAVEKRRQPDGSMVFISTQFARWKWIAMIIMVVCGLIGNLLPDRNTFYAIAIAAVSEQAVRNVANNEEVTGLLKDANGALRSWLVEHTKEKTEKK